jgi:hypothetical protein
MGACMSKDDVFKPPSYQMPSDGYVDCEGEGNPPQVNSKARWLLGLGNGSGGASGSASKGGATRGSEGGSYPILQGVGKR